jgi:NitT/TauT family transport system ATP-binding protein
VNNVEVGFDSVEKSFGATPVLKDVSLSLVEEGITVVLGPSGCGKTTLLRIAAGLLSPDRGALPGIEGRDVSFAFQEPRLLPWLSARENLRYVLREADETAIDEVLSILELTGFEEFSPGQLSGGMQHRLALARCYLYPSDLVLLDEPFRGLDLPRKVRMMEVFSRLWSRDRRTVLMVTHDVQEAAVLGDLIAILSDRPATVRARVEPDVPRQERRLGEEALERLQRELTTLLLGE